MSEAAWVARGTGLGYFLYRRISVSRGESSSRSEDYFCNTPNSFSKFSQLGTGPETGPGKLCMPTLGLFS